MGLRLIGTPVSGAHRVEQVQDRSRTEALTPLSKGRCSASTIASRSARSRKSVKMLPAALKDDKRRELHHQHR